MWTEDSRRLGEPGYVEPVTDASSLVERYRDYVNQIGFLRDSIGLSGAIYSQIADVERESTGLLTYDRAIVKVDPSVIHLIHSVLR